MDILKYITGVDGAAEILGLSPGTVKNMCASGKIRAKKIGKTWIIDTTNLNKGEIIMKKAIWEVEERNYLIDVKEIIEKYLLGESHMIVNGVFPVEIDISVLNERLKTYMNENDEFDSSDCDDMGIFMKNIGYENADFSWPDLYQDTDKDAIIYDIDSKMFYELFEDGYRVKIYEWFDGSNFQMIESNEGVAETIAILSNDYVDLDEWDGRNMVTGGIGEHERIYKVIEQDGEEVEDTFLLNQWSQWQGSHESGKIMSYDEVLEHLQEIGRTDNEYLVGLKNL